MHKDMVTEWFKVTGCKPVEDSRRRFESCPCQLSSISFLAGLAEWFKRWFVVPEQAGSIPVVRLLMFCICRPWVPYAPILCLWDRCACYKPKPRSTTGS